MRHVNPAIRTRYKIGGEIDMTINTNKLSVSDVEWLHEHAGKVIVLSGGACERENLDITVKEIIKR